MERRGVDNKFSGHPEKSAEWKLFYNARKMIVRGASISVFNFHL